MDTPSDVPDDVRVKEQCPDTWKDSPEWDKFRNQGDLPPLRTGAGKDGSPGYRAGVEPHRTKGSVGAPVGGTTCRGQHVRGAGQLPGDGSLGRLREFDTLNQTLDYALGRRKASSMI